MPVENVQFLSSFRLVFRLRSISERSLTPGSLAHKAGLHFPRRIFIFNLCASAPQFCIRNIKMFAILHIRERNTKPLANPFKQIHGVVVPENGSSRRPWKRENAASGGHAKGDMKIPVCEILLGKRMRLITYMQMHKESHTLQVYL